MTDKQLLAEVLEHIKEDIFNEAQLYAWHCPQVSPHIAYTAGATAYATQLHEANERERVLVEALTTIKTKADHGWPKDLALGTSSGTSCIQIFNLADEALSQYEGKKEVGDG